MEFNKQQIEAISTINGAVGVIAGAGSGKSSTLIERIRHMVEDCNINPSTILATTFTKNSALDLKKKLEKLSIYGVCIGTFHSICGKLLTSKGYNVKVEIKDYQLENLFTKLNNNEKVDVDDIKSFISYQKNYMKSYNDEFMYKDSKYEEEDLRVFFREYENYKSKLNVMDFDDYLLKAYEILKENNTGYTFDYILVDEHQDSNLIQIKLIDLLCPSGNVFCVYDYRQALYAFRGGNPEYCMDFKKYYPNAKIINLDYNYRSNKTIVDNANHFIKQYYGSYEYYSDSIANNKETNKVELIKNYDKFGESQAIMKRVDKLISSGDTQYKDIAIIYRNNDMSIYIENEFKLANIPYDIKDCGGFFKLKEVEIVLCMLRLIENPNDNSAYEKLFSSRVSGFKYLKNEVMTDIRNLASKKNLSFLDASEFVKCDKYWQEKNLKDFSDIISKLTRQHKQHVCLDKIINNVIGVLSLDKYIKENNTDNEKINEKLNSISTLKKFVRDNTLESFLSYIYCNQNNNTSKSKNDNKIQMMTIHGSKGLEFKYVFVVGLEDEKFPSAKTDIVEEARVFYVAITRPIDKLYISQIGDYNQFSNEYFN